MNRFAGVMLAALIALPAVASAQDGRWSHRGDRHGGGDQGQPGQVQPGQGQPGQGRTDGAGRPVAAPADARPQRDAAPDGRWQGRRDGTEARMANIPDRPEGEPTFRRQGDPAFRGQGGSAFRPQGDPAYRPPGDPAFRHQGDQPFRGQGDPAYRHQGGPAFRSQDDGDFRPEREGGPRHIVVDPGRRDGDDAGRGWQGRRDGAFGGDRQGRPARPDYRQARDGADWRDHGRESYGFDDRRGWNRGWRGDGRYNWSGYRYAHRGVFHLPRYYAPYGWGYGYRRFGIGFRLDDVLFAEQYWIDDPFEYRLPPVDGPYRWVRYYNDALLVDLESGEVVDTVYDIFW